MNVSGSLSNLIAYGYSTPYPCPRCLTGVQEQNLAKLKQIYSDLFIRDLAAKKKLNRKILRQSKACESRCVEIRKIL